MRDFIAAVERLSQALCAGLFLRIGPCRFEFENDRRGGGARR